MFCVYLFSELHTFNNYRWDSCTFHDCFSFSFFENDKCVVSVCNNEKLDCTIWEMLLSLWSVLFIWLIVMAPVTLKPSSGEKTAFIPQTLRSVTNAVHMRAVILYYSPDAYCFKWLCFLLKSHCSSGEISMYMT